MKKYLWTLCSLCVGMAMLTSCSKDDDSNASQLETSYVKVQNASYKEGALPKATTTERLYGVNVSSTATAGESDVISIVTDRPFKRFFIGVKGVAGYWEYVPTPSKTRAYDQDQEDDEDDWGDDEFFYDIPFNFGDGSSNDFTIQVSGEDEDGEITEPYEQEINYVEGATPAGKISSISAFGEPWLKLQYDSEGRLLKYNNCMDDETSSVSFTYSPLQMKESDFESTLVTNLIANSQGYVTSMSGSYEDDEENWSMSATIHYDSDGHLLSVSYGDSDGSSSWRYTWDKGNLVRAESMEDGDKFIVEATYGDDLNVAGQGTFGLCITRLAWYMCFTDLFGVQSKNLPIAIKTTGDGDDNDMSGSIRYDFNNDGTVKTEYFTNLSGQTVAFDYSYGSTSLKSKKKQNSLIPLLIKKNKHQLLKRNTK